MSPDEKPAPSEAAAPPSLTPALEIPPTRAPAPSPPPLPKFPFPPLFGKFPFEGVEVHDPGLKSYLYLEPVYAPHSEGRLAQKPFGQTQMHLVERLANNLMRSGKFTGKKSKALRVVREAFEQLGREQKVNPLQLLVDAVENAAPREEVTRLQFGGISVPRAVDASPSRRLAVALRNLALGSIQATKGPQVSISSALAREIALAAKGDPQSFAVARKEEVERVAQSAR